jgi:16S rRNA (guanine966-N2)-methyltransferase
MIECPQTGGVRPMLSRTRMAMFNLLGDALKGATVWDCFAGSGLLGIEAISRGAGFCVFVERDGTHWREVQANLASLPVRDQTLLIRGSVFELIKPGAPPLPHTPGNLLLLDPPHAMIVQQGGQFWQWFERLHETPLATKGTIACIGHPSDLHLPEEVGDFEVTTRREYGTVAFTLLR